MHLERQGGLALDKAGSTEYQLPMYASRIRRLTVALTSVTLSLLACALIGGTSFADDAVRKFSLEGEWTSGPNLVGYTFTLTNAPSGYSGEGYNWGCLGRYDSFHANCTESNAIITITLTYSKDAKFRPGESSTKIFTRGMQDSKPILVEKTDTKYKEVLRRTKDWQRESKS
jgi:hypothetical protein